MSDEAIAENFAEQVFEADVETTDMGEGPDSFDDLISEEYSDTINKESSEGSEDSDSEVLSSESKEGSAEDSKESGSDPIKADKADSEDGKEAESEVDEEVQDESISSYLKEEEEVKVNGELQSYSREHLLAKGKEMIAGEIAYDKKFTELDVQRKQYEGEVEEVEGYINKFGEIAKTGDVMGALQYFSEFTSIPPHELRQQLIQQMAPEIDRLRGLSETEIQLEQQKQENEYLQQKYETENQQLQTHQAQREVEKHSVGLQQTHNIAPAEWASATEELQEHLPESQELTPELIANYVITDRMFDQAEGLLDTVDVNLKEDGAVVQELYNIMNKNPEYTEADLKDIIISAFGEEQPAEQQTQLKRKINSNAPKQLKQKISENFEPITIDGEEVDDFDDIL
jgi:hypothetical protein